MYLKASFNRTSLEGLLKRFYRGLALDKQKKKEFLLLIQSIYARTSLMIPPVVSVKDLRRSNEDDKRAGVVKEIEHEIRSITDPRLVEYDVELEELTAGPEEAKELRRRLSELGQVVEVCKTLNSEQLDLALDGTEDVERIIRDYPHFGERLDFDMSLLEIQSHVERLVEDIKEILSRD